MGRLRVDSSALGYPIPAISERTFSKPAQRIVVAPAAGDATGATATGASLEEQSRLRCQRAGGVRLSGGFNPAFPREMFKRYSLRIGENYSELLIIVLKVVRFSRRWAAAMLWERRGRHWGFGFVAQPEA